MSSALGADEQTVTIRRCPFDQLADWAPLRKVEHFRLLNCPTAVRLRWQRYDNQPIVVFLRCLFFSFLFFAFCPSMVAAYIRDINFYGGRFWRQVLLFPVGARRLSYKRDSATKNLYAFLYGHPSGCIAI